MKKLYVIFLLSSAVMCRAQLTQANHAPANGDTYVMYQVDPTTVGPGAAGSGVTWNFTAATVNTNVASTYTAVTASNATYPAANVAVGSGTDNITYLSSTTSSLSYHGGNISVQSVQATLNYTSPAVYAAYPMTLNVSGNSAIGGSINVTSPQNASGTFTGNSIAVADGTGTLVLSGGTYTDVMRVSITQTLDFVVGGIFSGTLVMTAYEWYGGGIKEPLFTITSGTANVLGQTHIETLASQNKTSTGTTSIRELRSERILVYPQPGNSTLNIDNLPLISADMEVHDLAGRLVATHKLSQRSNSVDISEYPGGIFLYTIKSSDGHIVHSGRFTVAR